MSAPKRTFEQAVIPGNPPWATDAATGITVTRRLISLKKLRDNGDTCDIELKRIKTPAALVDWVRHLCGKGWMNTHRIQSFIEAAVKAKRFKIPNA